MKENLQVQDNHTKAKDDMLVPECMLFLIHNYLYVICFRSLIKNTSHIKIVNCNTKIDFVMFS